MASSSSQDIDNLARDFLLNRTSAIVTLTCLVYDYLITFEDEKRFVWPSRLSIVKVAFFLNRYMPFIALVCDVYEPSKDLNICKPLFIGIYGAATVGYCAAEFILYARAYAVWGCSRLVLAILATAFVACVVPGIYLGRPFSGQSAAVLNLQLFSSGCLFEVQSHVDRGPLVVFILSETLQMPNSMTIRRLFGDGIIYFIIILCVSIANIAVLSLTPPAFRNLLNAPQTALPGIVCSRLFLRIKGAYSPLALARPDYSQAEDLDDFELLSQLETIVFENPSLTSSYS
ncbi:hypothetical protein M0805_004429 [Coniferiporia weirii]|nr:hypothetical protein M0805_004429 [Coniferiporia weirii]